MPIPRASRALLAVISFAAIVALAGCGTPAASTSHSVSPTVTSTPTQAALTAPRAALPLTCAQLLPLEKVQSHLTDTVSVKVDETHLPPSIDDIAVIAAGGTVCAWGGQNMTDSSYDTGVTLTILPDAATDFATYLAGNTASGDVVGTIGQSSRYSCSPVSADGGDWCNGDALISNYWVSFLVNDISGKSGDGAVTSTLADVVSAIGSAGPARSNWTAPTSTIEPARWCGASDAAQRVGSIVGTAVQLTDYEPRIGIDGLAAIRADVDGCIWIPATSTPGLGAAGPYYAFVTIPAGSWAMPLLVAAPPNWTLIGAPTSISLTGATGAMRGCGEHCEAMIAVGNGLVDVGSSIQTSSEFDPILQRLVAASS